MALFLVPGLATADGADRAVPAVLVVDRDAADSPEFRLEAEAATELVSSDYLIEPPFGGRAIWPEFSDVAECATQDGSARVAADLAEGRRLFFEEMDNAAAAAKLNDAIGRVFSHVCLGGAGGSLHREACRAGVLLSRIFLLMGRPEAASASAASAADRCLAEEIAAEAVPPDVRTFMAGVLADASARPAPVNPNLRVVCPGPCGPMFIDGHQVEGGTGEAMISLPAGRHTIETAVPAGGREEAVWKSAIFSTDGAFAVLAVAPALGVRPLGGGTLLVAGSPRDAGPSIGGMLGMSVLGIVGTPDGRKVVTLHEHSGFPAGRVLAGISPGDGGVRFFAPAGSPLVLVRKKSWPWPWVTGSLSAGLLGAGIALNVLSNDSANVDVARSQDLRAGAIAGYTLAGAALLTTILLAVLRPVPEQSVLVVPSTSGVKLVF